MKKIVIIGAGASGIMAAIWASYGGAQVTVLERNPKPLKKLLMTGNGRCNLTNLNFSESSVRSGSPEKVRTVLEKFTVTDTLSFFKEIGVDTKERDGWVYPVTDSALNVAELLLYEAERLKIKIKTNSKAVGISLSKREKFRFVVHTEGWNYDADSVIVSCGTAAHVNEEIFELPKKTALIFGIKLYDYLPALVPLTAGIKGLSKWAGVRCKGKINLYVENEFREEAYGELQLTNYGISGIPVFEISRFAVKALHENKKTDLLIDFLPEYGKDEIIKYIERQHARTHFKSLKLVLMGLIPERLADFFIYKTGLSFQDDMAAEKSAHFLKSFQLPISGHTGFARAQVSQGGIGLESLSENMEAISCPGLYFTGEMTDADGSCGGYNLQWAWSSGAVAGKHCVTD